VLFSDATDEILKETASDPLRFAGEVLFDADSGPKLAKAFHRFLALAAEDLGVKCFLLPIDDVDTSFDKGWPLLETLRKYLATDRLITVVSGDLELFDLIVEQEAQKRTKGYRKAQKDYQNTDSLDEVDSERKYSAIKRFPSQYLKKVLPVNDRVRIPDIHSVILKSNSEFYIKNEADDTEESKVFPLGPAILVISRLLFGTAYVPGDRDGEKVNLALRGGSNIKVSGMSVPKLSKNIGPNAIDALIPRNTRRFISLIESIPDYVENLLKGNEENDISYKVREMIAENYSGLLRKSGMDVEDFPRLTEGGGYHKLSQALFNAKIGSVDLSRLQPDLFKDLSSYDQWQALLSLTSSALYADWTSNMTGMLRYTTKVWDTLSVAEQREVELDDIGAGLNEPSWKSRCRLLRTEVSQDSAKYPETISTAMPVPRNSRSNFDDSAVQISPSRSASPDYMRWWKAGWEENEGDTIDAKNSALMSENKFLDCTDGNARALYGLFRSALRDGRKSYRYVDFRRGLARIDDLVRGAIQDVSHEDKKNSNKYPVEISLDGLDHEALEFVLQTRGDSEQVPGSSETDESARSNQSYFKLEKVVREWVKLGLKISDTIENNVTNCSERNEVQLHVGANILPSPWALVDAYDRFKTDAEELSNLKWRQQTVGTMLERYTMAFWNALLLKETKFRIDQGLVSESLGTMLDSGSIRDNRSWIAKLEPTNGNDVTIEWSENRELQNSFTRNVDSVVDFWNDDSKEKESTSLLEIAPYTIFWMSCPFLLSLLSKESHNECVAGNFSYFEDDKEDGFLSSVYTSIKNTSKSQYNTKSRLPKCFISYFEEIRNISDVDEVKSERPIWQRSAFTSSKDGDPTRFDIHDILCGIVRPDKFPSDMTDEEQVEDKKYLKELGIVKADD